LEEGNLASGGAAGDGGAPAGGTGGTGGTGGGGGNGGTIVEAPSFTNAARIEALVSAQTSDDPTMNGAATEMYFNRNSAIYVTTRLNTNSSWELPTVDPNLSSASDETSPVLTPDGLNIYFVRTVGANDDVFVSARATAQEDWASPAAVAELNAFADPIRVGAVDSDELLMVVESQNSSGFWHIWEWTRADRGEPWQEPVSRSELDVEENTQTRQPWMSKDGLTIYFDSDATGAGDIYFSSRATVDVPFAPPVLVDGINTELAESDPWLSDDGTYLVFVRQDVAGSIEIFEADRTP
jgi:Tol biopolymer transport system component